MDVEPTAITVPQRWWLPLRQHDILSHDASWEGGFAFPLSQTDTGQGSRGTGQNAGGGGQLSCLALTHEAGL